MASRKWGESFLKSGLPLEHAVLVTFSSMDFECSPSVEYEFDDGNRRLWRELDLFASSLFENGDTTLHFLVECKYHDPSRSWFFLPRDTERWASNDRVFNCGPVQTLAHPRQRSALDLAPVSYRGIVVSEDGQKQDNAAGNAVKQLASGFVPYVLSHHAWLLDVVPGYPPSASAVVPMIVTNAKVYRLRTDLTSLSKIRDAAVPTDIADEVGWTWCYFDPPMDFLDRNATALDELFDRESELIDTFPAVRNDLVRFTMAPNWIAVVNLDSLETAISEIRDHFMSLEMRDVESVLGVRPSTS